MNADTRTNDELLDAARNGDEGVLAALVERHRHRLERMVRLHIDRRLQGRVDPADVVQEAYLTLRGNFSQYCADPCLPFFLWLRLEVALKLVDVHRVYLGTPVRDAGQEVSLHQGALPPVTSLSLAEHLLGRHRVRGSPVAQRPNALTTEDDGSGGESSVPQSHTCPYLRHSDEI